MYLSYISIGLRRLVIVLVLQKSYLSSWTYLNVYVEG